MSYKLLYKAITTSQWTHINTLTNGKTITGLSANTKYSWKVKSVCGSGLEDVSEPSTVAKFTTSPMRLQSAAETTVEVYPNPMKGNATISFDLETASTVVIELTDINAKAIKIISMGNFSAGWNTFQFNGEYLNSGIYFLRLITTTESITKKLVIE